MDLKFSIVTRKGPVTIVTLSRPEVYNALHTDAHFELNKVRQGVLRRQRPEMAGGGRQARLG
jgi:hypothetical protein